MPVGQHGLRGAIAIAIQQKDISINTVTTPKRKALETIASEVALSCLKALSLRGKVNKGIASQEVAQVSYHC